MQVLTAYHTDVGIQKQTNQDSLCIKVAETSLGTVAMAMVCDGMGGLAKGELASASVIAAFANWFDTELAGQLAAGAEDIQYRWARIIREQNQRIGAYGREHHINLGTTLTVLLIIGTQLLVGHVGDTRAYRLNSRLAQLTEDQTVVHREVVRGALTPEQAKADPRRNVLLQCIGASKSVKPDFVSGQAQPGEAYLLCSDGFRHTIGPEEIFTALQPGQLTDEAAMEAKLKELIEANKQRGENDNITAVLLCLK